MTPFEVWSVPFIFDFPNYYIVLIGAVRVFFNLLYFCSQRVLYGSVATVAQEKSRYLFLLEAVYITFNSYIPYLAVRGAKQRVLVY